MPFLLFLKGPKFWGAVIKWLPIILVVGAFIYAFMFVLPANAKLKEDLKALEGKHAELQENFDTYTVNTDLLISGIGANTNIRNQQQVVRERYRDVPVQVTEKPFADSGMQSRADIVRNYQNTSPALDNPGS